MVQSIADTLTHPFAITGYVATLLGVVQIPFNREYRVAFLGLVLIASMMLMLLSRFASPEDHLMGIALVLSIVYVLILAAIRHLQGK